MRSKEVFEFHSNANLIDEVERGFNLGYWDKALIPELKKRFKEIVKKEKLLELYKGLHDRYRYPTWKDNEEVKVILKQIKELEDEVSNKE